MSAPKVMGHSRTRHAPGDWRCKCGVPLGVSDAAAREAMRFHRAALAAQGRPARSSRAYRASRRQDPHVAAVEAWQNRTRNAALSMLARKFPAEYLALLDEVRAEDLRPVAEDRDERAA